MRQCYGFKSGGEKNKRCSVCGNRRRGAQSGFRMTCEISGNKKPAGAGLGGARGLCKEKVGVLGKESSEFFDIRRE